MTESEAIKIFNDLLDVPCEMLIKYDSVINSEKKQALVRLRTAEEIAIKALEKQIPKKPEYEADGYADGELVYDYAKCPICGHDFEYGINDWGCEYCSDCGQKLDWSEEE